MRETRPNPALDLAPACERLAELLDELSRAYVSLEACAEARDGAIRAADLAALGQAVSDESAVVQTIAEIEQRRGRVSEAIADALGAVSVRDVTAGWIAERVPAARERLETAGAELRSRIERVQRRNAASRVALETLSAHMRGLLQSTERRMSHAGVYGRRGSVEAGARVLSSMDLVS